MEMYSDVDLSDTQKKFLLEKFEKHTDTHTNAHTDVWKRRLYAPMFIDEDELCVFKSHIQKDFPNHTIVFDVLFESDGKHVEWHVDHESLGPFIINDYYFSLRNNDFISLHFNLTSNGGRLMVFDSILMSYVCGILIRMFGIFSKPHIFMTWIIYLLSPWFVYSPNKVFNNTKLHMVTKGAPRISYVVRLVHNTIRVSPDSITEAVSRSSNCHVFSKLEVLEESCVSKINWCHLKN